MLRGVWQWEMKSNQCGICPRCRRVPPLHPHVTPLTPHPFARQPSPIPPSHSLVFHHILLAPTTQHSQIFIPTNTDLIPLPFLHFVQGGDIYLFILTHITLNACDPGKTALVVFIDQQLRFRGRNYFQLKMVLYKYDAHCMTLKKAFV